MAETISVFPAGVSGNEYMLTGKQPIQNSAITALDIGFLVDGWFTGVGWAGDACVKATFIALSDVREINCLPVFSKQYK